MGIIKSEQLLQRALAICDGLTDVICDEMTPETEECEWEEAY